MFFCQKCRNFSLANKCQFCGAKKLREAQESDPVYLTTQNMVCAGMLAEALKRNNIPFIRQEKNGGVLKYVGLGFAIEEFSFYVPLGSVEKAKEILVELFTQPDLRLMKNPKLFKQGKRIKAK